MKPSRRARVSVQPCAQMPDLGIDTLGHRDVTSESFSDTVPHADHVTDYDLAHLRTYLRLLDLADQAGVEWTEAARRVFSVDPDEDPDKARRLFDGHLARARWMTRYGYRQLAAFERLDPRFR